MNGSAKPKWPLWGILVLLPIHASAQGQVAAGGGSDYAIAQVGPHSRVWQNAAGQSVTEIATGMNFLSNGVWTPSNPSFQVSQDGTSFVANQIQDPTQVGGNINSQGAISAVTPDGVTLRSTPVAIGLFDAKSGLSVIVASITNSTGVLVDPQHIVFTNAFVGGGFAASVVYSLPDAGSFHQDVVFTGFNPGFDPTVWGFTADSTNTLQIQIITEFYGDVPQPQVQERPLYVEQNPAVRASMASPDFIDNFFDFGHYVFGPGRAYTTSSNPGAGVGATVAKEFVTTNGRSFLVESFWYNSVAGYLQSLPPATIKTSSLNHMPGARRMKVAAADVPQLREIKKEHVGKVLPAKRLAKASAMPHGLSVDYIVTVSSLNEPKLYSSDCTYFVSGPVYETSLVTMESAVFKYPYGAGDIEIENGLTLATTNYRTAIFTSADDNTAGATLSTSIWSGYSGTPSSDQYSTVALWLATSQNIALNNVRFCYLTVAIEISADTASQTLTLTDAQLVDCKYGIYVSGGNGSNTNSATLTLTLNNCLMANVGTPLELANITLTGNGYNCTVDSCTNLFNVSSTSGSFHFTNSIFSTLTSKGTLGSLSLNGGNNGFYNSTSATFGSYTPVTSNPYQIAGAGNYYLGPGGAALFTAGTTNVGAALLSQLQMKTTEAPLYLTNTATNTIIVTPVVERDTAGTALGFHYDSIDFLASFIVLHSTTLTLSNGVALAYYDNKGIVLQGSAQLDSQGAPNQRNYLVYYNLVQEQPIALATNALAQSLPFTADPTSSPYPTISLRLTTICAPTGETNLLDTGSLGAPQTITSLAMRDCEIYGSGATWEMSESTTPGPTVGLTNNVFYRVPFFVDSYATITTFNNLFYGTTNYITNITVSGTISTNTNTIVSILYRGGTSDSPNTNENNVFDGVAVALDGLYGHNAYLHGAVNTNASTNTTDLWTNVTWQAGPFGSFYQPTNSPLLTNGCTNASNLGLFHYTVTTNIGAVEGSNVVSRGYHYVAVGTNGLPLDDNNDGVPDYLEDVNGDGTNNDAEPWNETTDPWIGTQPLNQYAVAGTSATFSVTAYGTAPLTYQWMTNSGNISGATSSAYTIPSAPSSDAWTYTVKVSNSGGNVISSGATLTIVIAPQLTNTFPPTNGLYWFQTNYDQLSTVVTNAYYGSATPAYYSQYLDPYLYYLPSFQWEFNGTIIPSASGTGGTVTFVATNDGGTNTVVITNPAGSNVVTWTNIIQAAPGMVETWGSDGSGECNRPLSLTNATGIAAGEYQSIAVTDSGSVVQWGQYSYGGTLYSVTNSGVATQPPTNGVVAVAAGMGHALALMNNGTVTAWGLSSSPAASIPEGQTLTNITAIACGNNFSLVLSNNGTIFAWGDNTWGQTNIPSSYRTNNIAISAGATHALALQSNGAVLYWGFSMGQTNPPNVLLTNRTVSIASGSNVDVALLSNGTVVAWGLNYYGETNVPTAVNTNIMAIAAGDSHVVALQNTGNVVAWGDNGSGQTNIPQSNPTNPVVVKLIAAGGNHTMTSIFSSWVQYPVNVSRDLLLIYNTNSLDSSNVCQYYLTHRPMVASANVLGIGCTNGEIIDPTDFASTIIVPIQDWLTTNATKRPSYVILFQNIPSRVELTNGTYYPSVQYQINSLCATNWQPFVSSINMNGVGGTNDCIQYINKLASMASNSPPGRVLLSGRLAGYGDVNYYFDDTESGYNGDPIGGAAEEAVIKDGVPSSLIDYINEIPDCGSLACHITAATNVSGYMCWGAHSSLGANYATNYSLIFTSKSTWYVIATIESFNGQRIPQLQQQGNFLSWYASNAFGGTNYSNTPVGAISNVEEPGLPTTNYGGIYFGLWAATKDAGISAWNAINSPYFQEVGDPLVTK